MPDMYLMEYDMELQNTLKSVDMYTESVISLLDKMESMQRNFDTIVKEDADGNGVLTKIKASISKIFTAMINTIQKGKIATTSTIQANKLTKLATIVKEFPSVNIKIQDVWSYSKFVDGLIDEHVRKFKRKNTLNLFDKLIGTGRAIDALIGNLDLMSEQMRNPKNKQFTVKGRDGKLTAGGKVSTGAKIAIGGAAVGAAKVVTSTGISNITDGVTTASKLYLRDGSGGVARAGGKKLMTSILPDAVGQVAREVMVFVGANGPLLMNAGLIIGGAVGLLAIAKVFTKCPRKIGTETITLQELYQRLVTLAPQKFASTIKADLQNASMYLTRTDCLQEFALTNGGSNSAVDYSRKISHLLTSYARFHQAMIDFYLSIVVNIVTGDKVSSFGIYAPKNMVHVENAD